MKIEAEVKNFKINPDAKQAIFEKIKQHEGQVVTIEVKRKNKSSLAQYGYLYAVVYPAISHQLNFLDGLNGTYTPDIVDLMMKMKFWYKEVANPATSELEKFPDLKRDMNKRQLSEYIDSCIKWAREFLSIEISEASSDYSQLPYRIVKF